MSFPLFKLKNEPFPFFETRSKSYPTTKNTNEHIPVLLLKFTALLCKFSYNVLLTKNKQNKSHVPLRGVPSFLFVHSGVPSIIKDSSLNQKLLKSDPKKQMFRRVGRLGNKKKKKKRGGGGKRSPRVLRPNVRPP